MITLYVNGPLSDDYKPKGTGPPMYYQTQVLYAYIIRRYLICTEVKIIILIKWLKNTSAKRLTEEIWFHTFWIYDFTIIQLFDKFHDLQKVNFKYVHCTC